MRLDAIGDRMKKYEAQFSKQTMLRGVPVYARIDGRTFHTLTRGMDTPYDDKFILCMNAATEYLVRQTGANIGYCQSDEISLGWYQPDPKKGMFFEYKQQKIASNLASMAAAAFCSVFWERFPDRRQTLPSFDARVCSLPNEIELMNMFLWRVQDARKNSISMAARQFFSHKQLTGIKQREMLEKLKTLNEPWEEMDEGFRYGRFITPFETYSGQNFAEEMDCEARVEFILG